MYINNKNIENCSIYLLRTNEKIIATVLYLKFLVSQ
jgi:hypothetical protein